MSIHAEVLLASLELLVAILWEERWSDSRVTQVDSAGVDFGQLGGYEIINFRYIYINIYDIYIYLLLSTNSIHYVWIHLPVYVGITVLIFNQVA